MIQENREEERVSEEEEEGGMEVKRGDSCDQVIFLEAIPLTTGKRRGCYMILVLYCSGDPELMGKVLQWEWRWGVGEV